MNEHRFRQWWRRSGRPYWRDVRPVLVVAAGLAVIVLGTIGYSRRHAEFGFWDSFYRAFGLFGLAGNEEPPVPWELNVARILGPLVFGFAALTALLALFRQEARLLSIRLFARHHVVVAGLGEKGFRVATALQEEGWRVIVVERSPEAMRAPGARERGITVLHGDATDPEMLRRAQTGRAAHIVAVCGDDGTNVDVAVAAEQLASERRSGVLTAHAHVQDTALWALLSSAAIGSEQPTFRLDFFNVFAEAARTLVARHPPTGDHVVVHGLDGIGEHLVLRIAAEWRVRDHGAGDRLAITLAGPGAAGHVARLRSAHPQLDAVADLRTEWPEPPSQAYVCLADEIAALAVALELRARAPGAEVVVAVADDESGVARALSAEGRAVGGITPFGVFNRALTGDVLRNALTEVLAQAKHDEYVRAEERRGRTASDNPSLCPWDELHEALKESNRRFADGISAKLAATGCVIVPAPLDDPREPSFAFTDAEVEELAIAEHDRWVADLRRDGWRPTTGPKDAERKLHPLLVPWDQLSEDDKDRDRDPVREIPAMVARLGYRIVRASDPAVTAGTSRAPAR